MRIWKIYISSVLVDLKSNSRVFLMLSFNGDLLIHAEVFISI